MQEFQHGCTVLVSEMVSYWRNWSFSEMSSVFQKLHFFQEEKNREIVALRQRIKELEENQHGCSRVKRRQL